MHDCTSFDVVVAGAGPVGLFLACELRLAGLSVAVLEQADDASTPLKRLPFGMRGLSIPSVEALYRRGLLDDVVAPVEAMQNAHWARQKRAAGGHFAGIPFFDDRIDESRWPYRLPNPAARGKPTTMARIETVLADRATALGVQIRRGAGVTAFEQTGHDVTIHAGPERWRARWLVGCDGGRSTVRKLGGFAFVGTEPEFTGYSVEIELADPALLAPGRHYTPQGMYTYQPPGTIAMVDFDGGAFHRTQPITREQVQAVLRRVSGVDVVLNALHLASTWTDRASQASTYRQGRLLLAGDAAHIHSPLGGQGLNLGLGDAMNLGWKLAAVVRGDLPETLLDTYFSERHPVGAQVLDWSRAQVGVMRPSPASRALEAILRDLVATTDGATYMAERVWEAKLRYPLGDAHPLVGCSVPDFTFGDDTTVGQLLRSGHGLLLDFDPGALLRERAAGWNGRIRHVAGAARNTLGLRAVLVRPDGVVAWAAQERADEAALDKACVDWFGPARGS
ncbi:FAD-dependent monooxygenase [Xylophilus sp. GOD-11R]|uniref:FAD-dependent monooxygenase n=1 Tax=Xylophilus sp. GOD-11R TaxID=3089814 RepID=UPI00298CABD5|nr:FAD-dependent monooxygenase [Xylophilus sp. GOD-11R]WPB58271.1 FAD-dependent monooxygenase [Xylophilus sp. GOD-11R]